jgi:hypothetical protein
MNRNYLDEREMIFLFSDAQYFPSACDINECSDGCFIITLKSVFTTISAGLYSVNSEEDNISFNKRLTYTCERLRRTNDDDLNDFKNELKEVFNIKQQKKNKDILLKHSSICPDIINVIVKYT